MSFAWNISRKTTSDFIAGIKNGTYVKVSSYNATSPSYSDLYSSYSSLNKGDAVVKDGDTFLIASNDTVNKKVYVYEQTPPIITYTNWNIC